MSEVALVWLVKTGQRDNVSVNVISSEHRKKGAITEILYKSPNNKRRTKWKVKVIDLKR